MRVPGLQVGRRCMEGVPEPCSWLTGPSAYGRALGSFGTSLANRRRPILSRFREVQSDLEKGNLLRGISCILQAWPVPEQLFLLAAFLAVAFIL